MDEFSPRTPPLPRLEGILPYPEEGEGLIIDDILTQTYMRTWYQLGYAVLAREGNLKTVDGASVNPPDVSVKNAMELSRRDMAVIARGMIAEARKLKGWHETDEDITEVPDVPLWRIKRADYLIAVALRFGSVAERK